ncbi:3-oxoacyl-ACP synthase III family protein [Streptomyces hawaiiensis]|uniref:3-oxoacyl-ACP synthase III family protein n=1 Tax=Streptomyces hawaiiensis TaxID=67305 RepID=UPI00364E0531
MTTPVDFGILSLGSALGEPQSVADTVGDFVDDPERVLRWGYRTYHRAAPGTTPTDLAARAARVALDRAGLEPKDVDRLIVADSDVPEYLHWDLSASVARAIGLRGTPTLLLSQSCAAATLAFHQAAGTFAVQPDTEHILVVAVNQVSEGHRNRMRTNTCLGSDGAAAAVLRRGHGRLRWLATEQITDPECADFFRAEFGGSAVPVAPQGRSNLDVDPLSRVHEHFARDPRRLREFVTALNSRIAAVVDQACARAGVNREDISRLIYLNDNQHSLAGAAEALGLPLERTNARLAAELGHCGGADQLLCLERHVEQGETAPGEVVALAGIGSGMHWFATLLKA